MPTFGQSVGCSHERTAGPPPSVVPAAHHSSDQLGKALDERRARDLVGVDAEDPVAGALRVQPREVALEVRELDAQNAVRDRVSGPGGSS